MYCRAHDVVAVAVAQHERAWPQARASNTCRRRRTYTRWRVTVGPPELVGPPVPTEARPSATGPRLGRLKAACAIRTERLRGPTDGAGFEEASALSSIARPVVRKRIGRRHVPQARGLYGAPAVETSRRPLMRRERTRSQWLAEDERRGRVRRRCAPDCLLGVARQLRQEGRHAASTEVEEPRPYRLDGDTCHL
ncbi:MAG: hypothetical protein QOK16_4239, partial [Solirubrobacteraceae bacterium]|nr:hypothetical protein [Solirubrobacteraceae bacterium]